MSLPQLGMPSGGSDSLFAHLHVAASHCTGAERQPSLGALGTNSSGLEQQCHVMQIDRPLSMGKILHSVKEFWCQVTLTVAAEYSSAEDHLAQCTNHFWHQPISFCKAPAA